ncbi:MAG: hypothetical protein U0992_10795 [Planctomycetaceae bacterium]
MTQDPTGSTQCASARAIRRSGRIRRTARLLLVAACLGSPMNSGCMTVPLAGPPPYRVVLGPGYDPAVHHRLLLLPIVGLDDPVATGMITEVLFNELRTVGPFEIVLAEPKPCTACEPPPSPYPTEEELAQLAGLHRPDAFLFVTVTSYSPYPPLELGLSIRVVSAAERRTLASIDTTRYAAQDVPFSNGDCAFARRRRHDRGERESRQQQPAEFVRLVSMHVAHVLALDPLPLPTTGSNWSILQGHWSVTRMVLALAENQQLSHDQPCELQRDVDV